jgi:Ca-activated chloride channel family protein
MNSAWDKGRRHQIAQKLLGQSLDSLKTFSNVQLALRVYGHQKNYRQGQDCNDTRLEVPFGPGNAEKIKKFIADVQPKGTTPIAMTLEKAAGDFPPCANCRNIIILITDGVEECGGDPCAISLKLQREGIILKPFVIGIGLDLGFRKSFECLGTFYDATNEADFRMALNVVISQALNPTTAQVNLIDDGKRANETDAGISLYDHNTGKLLYYFQHTLDAKGNPDTLNLEPWYTYDLVAHTLPPVSADSLSMSVGRHNILAVDAPQGYLKVNALNFTAKTEILFLVRKHKSQEIVHVQKVGERVKYIKGFYDIELLTTPRLKINDVAISQSHTTEVNFPGPGLVTILKGSKGSGDIYITGNGNMERVASLSPSENRESMYLQPGDYLIMFRSDQARSSSFTIKKTFTVMSGSSVSINL